MKLSLSPVDPNSYRPIYLQIAESLLERIDDGTLPPGAPLPSKRELQEYFGHGHKSVTAALDHLAARGHIVTSRGQVARVAERKPVMVDDADRWRLLLAEADYRRNRWDDGPPADLHGSGIDWSRMVLHRYQVSEEAAPPIVARRLGIQPGAPTVRREWVEEAPGLPLQVRVGWLDAELVRRAPEVAEPDHQPWEGGLVDELMTLGVLVSRIERHIRARHATESERADLDLPIAAPVLNTTWIFYDQDGRGVETSDTVTDAAGIAHVCVTEL